MKDPLISSFEKSFTLNKNLAWDGSRAILEIFWVWEGRAGEGLQTIARIALVVRVPEPVLLVCALCCVALCRIVGIMLLDMPSLVLCGIVKFFRAVQTFCLFYFVLFRGARYSAGPHSSYQKEMQFLGVPKNRLECNQARSAENTHRNCLVV